MLLLKLLQIIVGNIFSVKWHENAENICGGSEKYTMTPKNSSQKNVFNLIANFFLFNKIWWQLLHTPPFLHTLFDITNFIIEFFFALISEVTFVPYFFNFPQHKKYNNFKTKLNEKKIDEEMLEDRNRKAITLSLPSSNDLNLNVECEVMDF